MNTLWKGIENIYNFRLVIFSNSEVTIRQLIIDLALFSEAEQQNIASNVHLKINPDVKQRGNDGRIDWINT
jgi:hypothetical protein